MSLIYILHLSFFHFLLYTYHVILCIIKQNELYQFIRSQKQMHSTSMSSYISLMKYINIYFGLITSWMQPGENWTCWLRCSLGDVAYRISLRNSPWAYPKQSRPCIAHSFEFLQITPVSLPCSVKNVKMSERLDNRFRKNKYSRDLSLWGILKGNSLCDRYLMTPATNSRVQTNTVHGTHAKANHVFRVKDHKFPPPPPSKSIKVGPN